MAVVGKLITSTITYNFDVHLMFIFCQSLGVSVLLNLNVCYWQ